MQTPIEKHRKIIMVAIDISYKQHFCTIRMFKIIIRFVIVDQAVNIHIC